MPKRSRSIVFIRPFSLGLGCGSRGGCSEGPVKTTSGNQCTQRGALLIAPEWSEHFPDHRIRNVWLCEACGYEFEDTVYWSAREFGRCRVGFQRLAWQRRLQLQPPYLRLVSSFPSLHSERTSLNVRPVEAICGQFLKLRFTSARHAGCW